MFDPLSRYVNEPTYTVIDRRGRVVNVVPAPDKPVQTQLGLHRRIQGQRLDHLAFHYLKDPAGYWRICELADVMLPDALAEARDIPIPAKAGWMDTALAIKVGDAADAALAQASVVEVLERMGEPTTFRMRYGIDITDGDLPMLRDGRLDPGSVIQVLSVADGKADCLVKGPVHAQRIRLLHGGTGSYVDVLGADTSVTMDREIKARIWDAVTDSDVVSQIVAPYGFTADAETTPATHEEDKHTLVQHDSDLRLVRRLARRNGCLFWITADPTGAQTAHFRRPPLDGDPVAKLVINLDQPNLNALDISWDVERPTSAVGWEIDLADKSEMDGTVAKSPQKLLGDKGLADITGDTRNTLVGAPVDDVGDLKSRGEAALIEADFFLTVTGETSAHALGAILHAHTVVDLQGVGTRHSGPYFVSSVRHLIDATTHRMEFELVRNGWGA